MIINHNIAALNTHRQLGSATNAQSKSMEKLASGLRINKAGDDAAGLAISEKMRGQIRGLDQASRNSQDGISLIQTAEGALNETHDILQRMRELSNQSANGTATDADRTSMQDELNQLTSEINRIGNTTEFNTQKLLNGGIGSNDGAKITQAASAKIELGAVTGGTLAAGTFIKVDGKTFDLGGLVTTGKDAATATQLGNVTSGGTKLSDLVDITVGTTGLGFEAKSEGSNSVIEFSQSVEAGIGLGATQAATVGSPTTMERAGIEAAAKLTASDRTIAANSTFKITVGSESAVEVDLGPNAKTYDTQNTDVNVAKAATEDLVKDLNAALQKAGLSDKVTASISKDDKLQFISETGKDISLIDGTGTPLNSSFGITVATDKIKNVQQVVGPGAEGSGFSTKFQIGANTGQSMSLTVSDMRSAAIGITGNAGQAGFTASNSVTNGTNDIKAEAALNISTKENASKSIDVIDKAIASVSAERGKLGAVQNRLEHTINNLGTSAENLTAAESRIRDVDMAKEMMNQTKNSILSQAAQAMLAQANQQPQGVLQLLR
ncbi:flagellin [Peribacillus psychrosaccharolyticus]|uniref:Flagellin n=1 Tax=Peribacillus psychrosaccharolyticus TaxID=1407 RepID=A0A974RZA8_PERPY|nr:flagellin [Peribacillus psychrosaccharolyticus]MEC2055480.1 flagellin [Peribacillus psychrosaccharolyticus]MED3743492.1 flagellin [Peribacillus psychrosaccharolyticus]QQS99157.1 flagellin [Peribacillus psychrosaccharolyticus]